MQETSSAAPAVASSPRTQRKRPADFTGRKAEQLAEEKKLELQARANEIALVTEVEAEEKKQVIDYTGADTPLPEVAFEPEVEINDPYRTIRVNTKIEQMTFGREVIQEGKIGDPVTGAGAVASIMGPMRMFDFEEGRSYRVPKDLADHLNRLGYLAYIGT